MPAAVPCVPTDPDQICGTEHLGRLGTTLAPRSGDLVRLPSAECQSWLRCECAWLRGDATLSAILVRAAPCEVRKIDPSANRPARPMIEPGQMRLCSAVKVLRHAENPPTWLDLPILRRRPIELPHSHRAFALLDIKQTRKVLAIIRGVDQRDHSYASSV